MQNLGSMINPKSERRYIPEVNEVKIYCKDDKKNGRFILHHSQFLARATNQKAILLHKKSFQGKAPNQKWIGAFLVK